LIGGIFAASRRERGMSVLVKGAPETIKPLLSAVSVFAFFVVTEFWCLKLMILQVPAQYDACYQAAAGEPHIQVYNQSTVTILLQPKEAACSPLPTSP
jgi:hypothetical protein